jgi:hypothetical protein
LSLLTQFRSSGAFAPQDIAAGQMRHAVSVRDALAVRPFARAGGTQYDYPHE